MAKDQAEQVAEPKAFWSKEELARRWGVSQMTLSREVKRGNLKQSMIGGQVRFSAGEVARYEAQA